MQYVAVVVHTWSRVEGWEPLVEVLPAYCELDRVVAEERLAIDHAVPEVAPTVLETLDAWLAFSVRSIDATDVAPVVEEYGPDRILIDTDLAGTTDADPFETKRTVLDLLRLGVLPEDVRRVVHENPCALLGLEP